MEIGIKFCGGCNSCYDRGEEFQKLKAEAVDVDWIMGDDTKICDYWFIVCGCARACVEDKPFVARKEVCTLKSPMDFQMVRSKMKNAGKEEPFQRRRLSLGMMASIEKKITEADVIDFARLTKDDNKMHMDAAFAGQQWFQKPIAHGMLAGSLISSVMGTKLPGDGTILMGASMEFVHPVYMGDTITAKVTFTAYKEEKIYYIGDFCGEGINQDGVCVVRMEARQMMMKNLFEIKGE